LRYPTGSSSSRLDCHCTPLWPPHDLSCALCGQPPAWPGVGLPRRRPQGRLRHLHAAAKRWRATRRICPTCDMPSGHHRADCTCPSSTRLVSRRGGVAYRRRSATNTNPTDKYQEKADNLHQYGQYLLSCLPKYIQQYAYHHPFPPYTSTDPIATGSPYGKTSSPSTSLRQASSPFSPSSRPTRQRSSPWSPTLPL
jgi:hypothetical protein